MRRGPWGVPGGSLRVPGVPGVPSVRDTFETQANQENILFLNILENNILLICRANNPIIVKGWLNFGALVGYPLCAIVWLHFLIQFLIRKPILFWWHFFQKLEISVLCTPSFLKFPQIFMFPQISSFFLQFYLSSFIFLFKIKKTQHFWKIAIHIFGEFWILSFWEGWADVFTLNWLQAN